jgi:3-hydroxybutyrate dehydrogenase
MMTLAGRVAIVTGSTSGIGLGIAQQLAAAGADILLNGFGNSEEIETIRKQIESNCSVRVGYSGADMSKPDQIEGMIKKASAEFGRVDILVNNAGIQYTADVKDFPPERWESIIAINLSATFYATRAVLHQMLDRNWGRIINIASTHGLVGSPQKSAYVAAKHGVVGLTKVVALETAKTRVTCNAICPGWVLTPLVQKQIDARARDQGIDSGKAELEILSEKQPSLQFVTPQELGAFAVFLCSDAAQQIRGQALAVDGAWTAQ